MKNADDTCIFANKSRSSNLLRFCEALHVNPFLFNPALKLEASADGAYCNMAELDYGSLSERKYLIVHDPKTHLAESPKERFFAIVFGGSLLSFNAGFINVISLLISNVLVSHTTGNITKSAITLTEGEYFSFLEVSVMLPCFVFGSFITTMLIDQRTFHLTKQFNVVFLVCTMLLTLASFVGVYTTSRQLYAYLATIACGMQNALTTKYSGRYDMHAISSYKLNLPVKIFILFPTVLYAPHIQPGWPPTLAFAWAAS